MTNSDEDKIRIEPYCPFKDFYKVSIMTFFRSALRFPIFLTNFDQRIIQFDPFYPCFTDCIKKKKAFPVSNIHRIGIKDKTV